MDQVRSLNVEPFGRENLPQTNWRQKTIRLNLSIVISKINWAMLPLIEFRQFDACLSPRTRASGDVNDR